ncbi:MAG: DUF1501 domain-containing protein, partial [Planctomycetaceae bacterium]
MSELPHGLEPIPPLASRRGVLHAGLLGWGGLSLAGLLRQRALAGPQLPKDTAVIFLFLHGGPSQLETYDLKPQAPSEYRGPLSPIATNVPGMEICEYFPLQAQRADRFSI